MTNNDLTRSLIYLDTFDMDGLIDIARFGVDPTSTNEATWQLIQRLAIAIVDHVSPHDEAAIRAQHQSQTYNDESPPQFSAKAALAVFPLASIAPLGRAEG